ncbi:DNA mismatch repair protein MutL [Ligilactobacillus murinus]|uniref:DNA mismatch repair endonuclease MutL n=1 Tax=Ligilactobacillus murinus TaxID=1622 RepID=UPI0014351D25|nr:DNA mismatch repair endonuclease MutL [Ligilactobacillus murinus]BDI02331.1 DNA mismatch repair protein MutL [Ligilactobacillus murinus]GFI63688.1 DNA mismatch repair protein MutL [Lactobacillaceae bacterium]
MAKIHELATVLADQIAAGEVVERPASVVKELVENAIDANSTQIDIYVKEAGIKEVTVIDNGEGIAAEDVPLAFFRHATSKIKDRQDLFQVNTLGFRGEALPSIASVADVCLETALQTETQGTFYHVRGGEVTAHKPAAMRQGTKITVTDLFYNTPARLKYLSSLQTELAAISDIVNRLALSHGEIAFALYNNGKKILQTAGNGKLIQTVSAIYGIQNARQMVSFLGEDLDFKVQGYVSLPKLTRASRNYISLLINGRYIKNKQLLKAVLKGYGSKLMVGRYPFGVIDIHLDPLLVDVNVHPTKQEVRISKEEQLADLIEQTIYARLAKENLIPSALENLNSKPKTKREPKAKQLDFTLAETSDSYEVKPKKKRSTAEMTQVLLGNSLEQLQESEPAKAQDVALTKPVIIEDRRQLDSDALKEWDEKYQTKVQAKSIDTTALEAEADDQASQTQVKEKFPGLTYIGQLHGTYLLAQAADGLYLVDQHAAQERCKYEYYREAIGEVSKAQQELLVPIILAYPTTDTLKISENRTKLAELGIELEEFGQNTFIVRHHPTWFIKGQEEDTLREMIEWFLADHKLTVAKFREKTAIMMSCKRSIKANHHLDDFQAKSLLDQLAKCNNPFNCPHGRPTLVHFSNSELERMFKRIQDPHQGKQTEL